MIKLTFGNMFESVNYGDTILYDGTTGVVEFDNLYNGGIKVNGMSLKYILENYKDVYLIVEGKNV